MRTKDQEEVYRRTIRNFVSNCRQAEKVAKQPYNGLKSWSQENRQWFKVTFPELKETATQVGISPRQMRVLLREFESEFGLLLPLSNMAK